jgi:hypothetical protein
MKLSSFIPAAATASNTTLSAALSSLSLLSPQRFNKPLAPRMTAVQPMVTSDANLQAEPSIRHRVQTVEITFGTDPQVLVRRAVNTLARGPLRNFLRTVMAARDVNRVLTLVPGDGGPFQRLPIDRLRAAAEAASYQGMQGPRARDTLYAAVVVAGIESLLGETVESPYTSGDVIRSVVRDTMRTLDAVDADQAQALRNCLGWGNEDESYNARTQALQYRVIAAVQNLRNARILARHGLCV